MKYKQHTLGPQHVADYGERLIAAPSELIEALTQAERSLGEMLGLAQVLRGERVLHESQAADQIRATDALNTTRAAIKKARSEE